MTYRDDLQAARMRRDALARELREVRNRMDEYQELARQEEALEREIAQTARDIEQARTRVELPLLASVRVASPCKERWSEMTGDDHVRFCGRCEKNVYDLSSLTSAQAEALLRGAGESMCVRFFRRSDGTILTSDCPVGARRKNVWRRAATAAVATGLAAAGFGLDATIDLPEEPDAMHQSRPSDERLTLSMGGAPPRNVYAAQGNMTVRDSRQAEQAEIVPLEQQIVEAEAMMDAAVMEEDRRVIQQYLESLRAEARGREQLARLGQGSERR
jgi:hypothetical protein